MKGFGLALKKDNLAHIELEKERLAFELERVELEHEDREKDRVMHCKMNLN